jgi:hypothetical protein
VVIVSRALVGLAVRRWPADMRADLRAEWLAELHVLATQRHRVAMLRYALSLAASRGQRAARRPLLDADATLGQAVRHALFLIVGPTMGIVVACFAPPLMALLVCGFPAFFAYFTGMGSPLARRWALVVAAVVPATAALWAAPAALPELSGGWREPASLAGWAVILGATLLVAARLPLGWAVPVGVAGALVASWIGATLAIWPYSDMLALDPGFAALWYPQSLIWPIDLGLGARMPDVTCLPGEDWCSGPSPRSWVLQDFIEGYSTALTVVAATVVAYVLAGARDLLAPAAGAPAQAGALHGARP